MEKSSIFIAGVTDRMKNVLLRRTGYTIREFPIRFLGLSLSSKKWSKLECQQLIDKITSRITTTYAKQLSYAGRLQVLNAVLFSIHSFWGSTFILPQRILKEVDRKCREYLWGTQMARENHVWFPGIKCVCPKIKEV